jgi:hypothetical protein
MTPTCFGDGVVASQEGELVWEKIREFLQPFAFENRYGEAR